MQNQRLKRYGMMAGLLAGVACAGHSGDTEAATVAKDTTMVQNPPAYVAPDRDTTMAAMTDSANVTDSAKWSPTKSEASEVQPGESTAGVDSMMTDTLRTGSDTTAQ